VGESFSTDVMSVYNTAGTIGSHDFAGRQAAQVVYQHPGQHGNMVTANGDYHVDAFIRSVATTYRAMDKVAGRQTQRCVPAWQVYK